MAFTQSQTSRVPRSFLCPISLEIMKDPVTVCTGQTYDRASIEKWLKMGHDTCPVTMLHLRDFTLIPNLIVRRLIQVWCADNGWKGSVMRDTTISSNHLFIRARVLEFLRKIARGNDIMIPVKGLKQLAKEREENRTCIVETGGTLLLVSLLWVDPSDSLHEGCEACQDVLGVLRLLCTSHAEARRTVVETQKLDGVIWHLANSCLSARLSATGLLKLLFKYEDSSVAMGNDPRIIQGFVSLLREDLDIEAGKCVVKALQRACLGEANRVVAVEAGAVSALVEFLQRGRTIATERALSALELLCTTSEGKVAACRHPLFFPTLVDKMVCVSHRCSELASICMLEVCKLGRVDVLRVAKKTGACRQLLLILQSDGTPRAKCNAQELLKLLYAVLGRDE